MDDPKLDDALEALANEHRRRLLAELREHNPHGELPERGPAPASSERLAAQMYHVHLPKLEAAGFVEWDRETGTVVRGPEFDVLVPLLETLSSSGSEPA